jgi:hypothetical protein
MLKEKLQTILSTPDPNRYGNRYWTYSISKNWLELIVPHQFRNKPEFHRLAVIHCGQVIKSILTPSSETDHLQVKTFPDLDKSHIVAMIRDTSDSLYSGRGEIVPCPETDMIDNEIDLIRLLASCYNFEPKLYPHHIGQHDYQSEHESNPINSIEIYSRADNPMVWLKTGYFLECLSQKKKSEKGFQPYDFNLSLHTLNASSSLVTTDEPRYRQLLLNKRLP